MPTHEEFRAFLDAAKPLHDQVLRWVMTATGYESGDEKAFIHDLREHPGYIPSFEEAETEVPFHALLVERAGRLQFAYDQMVKRSEDAEATPRLRYQARFEMPGLPQHHLLDYLRGMQDMVRIINRASENGEITIDEHQSGAELLRGTYRTIRENLESLGIGLSLFRAVEYSRIRSAELVEGWTR